MPEDEYDFEGLNPAELFTIDEHAEPFAYKAQLRQKGHTKNSPPDPDGLFKALATEYVSSIVVNLPPKVVERVSWRTRLLTLRDGCFTLMLIPFLYGIIIVGAGIVVPYLALDTFETKIHMQTSARCTITSEQIYNDGSVSDPNYVPSIALTLHAPGNQNYDTTDRDPPNFSNSYDGQAYLSQYQVNHTYPCWYNPADPIKVSLVKGVTVWDYIGLFVGACLFLMFGVIVNALIIWAFASPFFRRLRRRRA